LPKSERCFTLKELGEKRNTDEMVVKKLANDNKVNKPIYDEEATKFFKLMKHGN
jgi:hypothetical protein